MDEQKGIALAILGIVAVLAIVGLILMFAGQGVTGNVARDYQNYVGQYGKASYGTDSSAQQSGVGCYNYYGEGCANSFPVYG